MSLGKLSHFLIVAVLSSFAPKKLKFYSNATAYDEIQRQNKGKTVGAREVS
jgi:hypothetical protein